MSSDSPTSIHLTMPEPTALPDSSPEEHTPAEALRRLTDDLRDERTRRDMTLEQVYERTRVPIDVLKQFETDGLIESKMFNQVYLRSLLRSYAFAVGLPVKALTEVFDDASDGRYDPTWITRAAASIDAELEKKLLREAAEERRRLEAEGKEVKRLEAERRAREAAENDDRAAQEHAEEELRALTAQREEESARRAQEAHQSAAASGASWETASGRSADRAPAERKPRVSTSSDTPWGLIVGAALALLLIAGAAFWFFSGDEDDDGIAQNTEQTDETTTVQPTRPPPPSPDDITLPDQLTLTVRADGAPIQNLKITRDEDVRRPYWIEIGESRDFPFTDEATLCLTDACQPLPDFVVVSVQSEPFPKNASGATVINRDALRQVLAAARATTPAPADTTL